jgi:hypothetical protein
MSKLTGLALVAVAALLAGAAQAEPTHVMIRAQALDAKFIGDHTGGAQITLTDAMTGAVLAKGLTKGGTGDTSKIMRPRVRGSAITDAATAGFEALLDLKRPTLVRAEATSPAAKSHPSITVSSSLWIIPGHDITGEGWVLTIPGLIVEPAATPVADGGLNVSAKVSPMCGCPIEPGGIWDSANYSVEATLLRGEQVVAHTALVYAGQPGQFAGVLQNSPRGRFVLRLVATDSKSTNSGVAEQPVELK